MVHKARPGHPGGDFSAIHILATLYVRVLNHDPANPAWPDRGRFILSKGPAIGALYTVLAKAGFFPETLLDSLRQPRSRLNGHPNRNGLPGVETNTGALGHGLPTGLGMAIAGQITGAAYRTFVLTGDGEVQEGSNWEAAPPASDRPRAIIANTTKGKGVSFMENQPQWHHGVPNDAQFAQAMQERV